LASTACGVDFPEPAAHPISRYEPGWRKNPFTLKTAPVAVQKESFARDLALAGWLQASDASIVILMNTKTREYTRLKNHDPAADGTKVKSSHLEDRHAAFVELERNNETAVVRYDDGFLRQMAARGGAAQPDPPPVVAVKPRKPFGSNNSKQGPPPG